MTLPAPIKLMLLPEYPPPEPAARTSVSRRAGAAALAISIAVHGAVLSGYAMLHAEPPRLISAQTLEITLIGGAPAPRPAPPAVRPAPQPAAGTPAPEEPAPAASAAAPPAPVPANAGEAEAGDRALTAARYDVAALNNPKPPYPLNMRRRGIEGRVVLTARVRADGSCEDVRLKQGSGHDALDAAALATVRKWRFLPARRAGAAVEAWIEVPIVFRLDG